MIITRYKGTKIIAKRAKDIVRIVSDLMEADKKDELRRNNADERMGAGEHRVVK